MAIGYPVSDPWDPVSDPWDPISYDTLSTTQATFLGYTVDGKGVYATDTKPTIYATADGKLSSYEIKVTYKPGEIHPTVEFLEDVDKKIMYHYASGAYVTPDGAKFPSMAAAKKYMQNTPKQPFPHYSAQTNDYTTSDGMVWSSSYSALKHQNNLNYADELNNPAYTVPKYDDEYTFTPGKIIPGDKTVPAGNVTWDTASAHQIIADVKKAKTAFEKLNDNIKKHNDAHKKKKKLVKPIGSTRKSAKGNFLGNKREIEDNDYEDHDDYLGEDYDSDPYAPIPIAAKKSPVKFNKVPVPTPLKLTDADRAYIEAQVKKYEQQTGKPFVDKKYVPVAAKFRVTLKSGGFFYTTEAPTEHIGTTGKKTFKSTDTSGKKRAFYAGYTIEAVNLPDKIPPTGVPGFTAHAFKITGNNIKVTKIDEYGSPILEISTVPEAYKIQNGVEAPAHLYAGEVACDVIHDNDNPYDPNGNGVIDIWYANSEPKNIAMINGKAYVQEKSFTKLKDYFFLNGDQHQLQYTEPETWLTFKAWKKFGGGGFTDADYDPHSYSHIPGGKLVVKVKFYHYAKSD